jgi:sugar phosphate isomerase/epimerase
LREELLRIELAGADCAELVSHGLDVAIGGKVMAGRAKTVMEIMSGFDLRYTLHLPYEMNLLEPGAEAVNEAVFVSGLEFAKMAGIDLIVYHAGVVETRNGRAGPTAPTDELFEREARLMRRLAGTAEDVLICMENGPFYGNDVYSSGIDAESMVRFCEAVGMPNFKLTFDVGHYFLRAKGDADELLRAVATVLPRLGHLHLHDNCGIPLPMENRDYNHRLACGAADLHLPLGWGRIPARDVLAALSGYEGTIILEIEKRFEDRYAPSLELARGWLGERDAARSGIR